MAAPGFGWSARAGEKRSEQCSCCFPDIPAMSSTPLSTCLVHQLSEHFSDPGVILNEYAFLHPDSMNGELFFRPEPTKLAIASSVSKEMFKQAKIIIRDKSSPEDVLNATRAMLLISGDCYTAWNVRKAMIQESTCEDSLDSINKELQLVSLVFSFRSKASNAWAHRRWVCSKAFVLFRSSRQSEVASAFWDNEYECCEEVAKRHTRNYFAWSHRIWISRQLPLSRQQQELNWVNHFLSRNVSDRSAAHYCEQLTVLCISTLTPSERCVVIETQLQYGWVLIDRLPGHEALWQHMRVLVRIYLEGVLSQTPSLHDVDMLVEMASGETNVVSELSDWNVLVGYIQRCRKYTCEVNVQSQRKYAVSAICDAYFVVAKELQEVRSIFTAAIHRLCAEMLESEGVSGDVHVSNFCESSNHSALWKGIAELNE